MLFVLCEGSRKIEPLHKKIIQGVKPVPELSVMCNKLILFTLASADFNNMIARDVWNVHNEAKHLWSFMLLEKSFILKLRKAYSRI